MPQKDVTLTNDVGLHARPAAVFAKKAASFACDVTVAKGDKEANAKSILSVLQLDVRQGDTVTLKTMGESEDQALVELVELVESL
jgi:phosphocarrier protein HPr